MVVWAGLAGLDGVGWPHVSGVGRLVGWGPQLGCSSLLRVASSFTRQTGHQSTTGAPVHSTIQASAHVPSVKAGHVAEVRVKGWGNRLSPDERRCDHIARGHAPRMGGWLLHLEGAGSGGGITLRRALREKVGHYSPSCLDQTT